MKRIATSLFGLWLLPTVGFAGQTVGYNPTEEMYLSAYIACNRSAANKIALFDGSEGQLAAQAAEYCSLEYDQLSKEYARTYDQETASRLQKAGLDAALKNNAETILSVRQR
ncbi:hypothetical protein F9K73_15170 [Brucella intermedia]|uniref:hypothetical protein n=1 Tax=Brucella intermedia TaxID=94625 RepID=UPI00124E1F50|nr:hypothetical protein [Brucella intermedia]KAB2719479.1 hypothetical protein F9K73_15170 [Brucella intermedia]